MIDSHCHLLNMQYREPSLLTSLTESMHDGSLWRCIDVATGVDKLPDRLALMAQCGVAYYTVGLYPSHANEADLPQQLSELESQIKNAASAAGFPRPGFPSLVAVGEIGIDQFRDYAPLTMQMELLVAQIELANRHDLPVIIHNRESEEAILECLNRQPANKGGILHCFSSNHDFAVKMIDRGFLVSFAGNLTYKNSSIIQEAAKKIPSHSMVCETDSPYLSPAPLRGTPNHPGNVKIVYEFLAELRGIRPEECSFLIAENLQNLLAW